MILSILQTKTNSKKEKSEGKKRSSSSPFLDSQQILKKQGEHQRRLGNLTFHLCLTFMKWYFAALCFALSVPWCRVLHCMILSLLSNIAGEDPKAEKFLSKRLGAWLGFINLAPWVSDLHIPYSGGWNALGRFALAPEHSTDSLCGSGSRCTWPAFKLHLLLFSSREDRHWQEAFLPLTLQLPSFLPGLLL